MSSLILNKNFMIMEDILIYLVLLLFYVYNYMLEIKFDDGRKRKIMVPIWIFSLLLIFAYPIYLGGWYLLLLIPSFALTFASFLWEANTVVNSWIRKNLWFPF